jgi:hypothetical protein
MFDWLHSISCVESVVGRLRDLHIVLRNQPGKYQLRDLIALFYRYRMNMKPLAALKTKRNAGWFADPKMFWYQPVFGKKKTTRSIRKPATVKARA